MKRPGSFLTKETVSIRDLDEREDRDDDVLRFVLDFLDTSRGIVLFHVSGDFLHVDMQSVARAAKVLKEDGICMKAKGQKTQKNLSVSLDYVKTFIASKYKQKDYSLSDLVSKKVQISGTTTGVPISSEFYGACGIDAIVPASRDGGRKHRLPGFRESNHAIEDRYLVEHDRHIKCEWVKHANDWPELDVPPPRLHLDVSPLVETLGKDSEVYRIWIKTSTVHLSDTYRDYIRTRSIAVWTAPTQEYASALIKEAN